MRTALALCVWTLTVHAAAAQSAENVAIVINESSPESRTIGEYYAAKRGVPDSNILRIRTTVADAIDRATFTNSIEWPLRTLISSRRLNDRVLYLVLTKGLPIRITGTTGRYGTAASVDSELTLLYRRMVGLHVPTVGYVDNPYFAHDADPARVKPFTHRDHDIYLVSRLDAFTVDEVLALIDRAVAPAKDQELSIPPLLVNRDGDLLSTPDERCPAGSISVGTPPYQSVNFRETVADTATARRAGRVTALTVGEVIRHGVTAVAGESDPAGTNLIRPDILFPAYLAGASSIEAFYRAMAYLSAGTVVIADPLSAPYRQKTLTRSEIEADEDPETELPTLFAERRIANITGDLSYLPRAAVLLSLKATLQLDRGNDEEARVLLEQATAMAPTFASAQFTLGALYTKRGDHDRAIERFQLAVEASPPAARQEVVGIFGRATPVRIRAAALNNLAYELAVHHHAPADALPVAVRALASAPNDPSVLDTIAWVEHLLGHTANAARYIRAALAAGQPTAAIHVHAATIFAASGAQVEATAHLKEALRLQPALMDSGDVEEIRPLLRVVTARADVPNPVRAATPIVDDDGAATLQSSR